MEFEDQVVNRPPLFKGEKYDLWKLRMPPFLEFSNVDLLSIVKKDISRILDSFGNFTNQESCNEEKKKLYQLNAKARHILLCVLSEEETSKVHAMTSAKDIRETITFSHEGFKEVRQNKLTLLQTQYEMFRMEENKYMQSMIARLQKHPKQCQIFGNNHKLI